MLKTFSSFIFYFSFFHNMFFQSSQFPCLTTSSTIRVYVNTRVNILLASTFLKILPDRWISLSFLDPFAMVFIIFFAKTKPREYKTVWEHKVASNSIDAGIAPSWTCQCSAYAIEYLLLLLIN